jgi:hypothetical protein
MLYILLFSSGFRATHEDSYIGFFGENRSLFINNNKGLLQMIGTKDEVVREVLRCKDTFFLEITQEF